MMDRTIRYAISAALLLAWGAALALPATKAVLLLSSERYDFPAAAEFQKGLRDGLADPAGSVEFYVEYLDVGRFPAPDYDRTTARYLAERYAGRRIDVVVALVDAAFEFALAHRARLFPGVPLIGAAVEQHAQPLPAGVSLVPSIFDYRRTLGLALALQPDAREVVVVHGLAEFDLRRRNQARPALEALAPRLSHRFLSGVPLAAIEDEVQALPPGSLVLLLSMVKDAEGRALVGADYAALLAAASPVPVYSTFDSHLRRGALAGAITDWQAIGRSTAAAAAASLAGEPAPAPAAVEAPLRVNWTALEKWRIPPGRVPREAQVLFREPGLWDRHRNLVLAAVAAVLLQAVLIFGLILQLRQRQHAEDQLRHSEERLRLTAEAARIGMWGWTLSGERMWATDDCRALYGLPHDLDLSFGAILERVVAEDRETLRRSVQDALRERRPFAVEYRVLDPHGDTRWLVSRGRGTYGDAAEPLHVLGISADVTERRRADEAALRKQQELEHVARVTTMGELAASLAHELSQPLGAILANAQAGLRLYERGAADPAEVRAILQDVVADDRRAGEVVAALRAMLRREKSESAVLDAGQMVRDVLALLHGELVAQNVTLEAALEPGCPVRASKTQIEQVLINLVMNAVDAMRERPPGARRLRVAVSRAGREARFAVRDSGVGIPADQLDRVFEAFWTTKTAGLGMGLAICSSIVKSHGGGIRVEPNPDQGVTFAFTLPLAAAADAQQAAA